MYFSKSETVGSIVVRNLQAASIFNTYGIDFFSKGARSVEHACIEEHVPISEVLDELAEVPTEGNYPDFSTMQLSDLTTYILRNHHKLTEKKVVFIKHTLDRLAREQMHLNSNIDRIGKAFGDLSMYLTVHMKHEEFIVFPFIQKMTRSRTRQILKLRAIEQAIAAMCEDHGREISMIKELATLTNNYSAPRNSDFAMTICYNAMKELTDDLKIHMHLENNILFPRAISLATCMSKQPS